MTESSNRPIRNINDQLIVIEGLIQKAIKDTHPIITKEASQTLYDYLNRQVQSYLRDKVSHKSKIYKNVEELNKALATPLTVLSARVRVKGSKIETPQVLSKLSDLGATKIIDLASAVKAVEAQRAYHMKEQKSPMLKDSNNISNDLQKKLKGKNPPLQDKPSQTSFRKDLAKKGVKNNATTISDSGGKLKANNPRASVNSLQNMKDAAKLLGDAMGAKAKHKNKDLKKIFGQEREIPKNHLEAKDLEPKLKHKDLKKIFGSEFDPQKKFADINIPAKHADKAQSIGRKFREKMSKVRNTVKSMVDKVKSKGNGWGRE